MRLRRAVAQNLQSRLQPTWEETQAVIRFSAGIRHGFNDQPIVGVLNGIFDRAVRTALHVIDVDMVDNENAV